MDNITIEICAFSIDAAIKAQIGGANRIELCSNPVEGGTTPNYGFIKQAREKLTIPIFPIIRPRGGDFCYSADEFEIIKNDVIMSKQLGCSGIAFGILTPDNKIDLIRLKEIVKLAQPMEVTFIRAFDLTANPLEAIELLIEAGCKRVLTSGLAKNAIDATDLLKILVSKANGRISIMAGSGVNSDNLKILSNETGIREFHASARKYLPNRDELTDEWGFGQNISSNLDEIIKIRQIANEQ